MALTPEQQNEALVRGMFGGELGDTDAPASGSRRPFLDGDDCPVGKYCLEVIEIVAITNRKKQPRIVAGLKVVSGPEGAPPEVCKMFKRESDYFLPHVKGLMCALLPGHDPAEINDDAMVIMLGEDQPAAGLPVGADVFRGKAGEGYDLGLKIANFHPWDPAA